MKYFSFLVFYQTEVEIKRYNERMEKEYYSKNRCPYCDLPLKF
jgi:hypothetical protein